MLEGQLQHHRALPLSLQVGTAVARGSASATPTGRSLSLVVGTATASGGAGSPGNATPSGVSVVYKLELPLAEVLLQHLPQESL